MPCIAPSFVVSPAAASAFGLVAEGVIASAYLKHVGRAAFFPAAPKDFQDISLVFGNQRLFTLFLKTNNRLSALALTTLAATKGLVRVPDLMTHDPPRRMEFYEIKPNSIDGRADGMAKIAGLSALFAFLGVGYRPGTIWKPSDRVLLWSGFIMGARIEAFLFFFRAPAPQGLIVYELCIEGEIQKVLEQITIAVLIATVVVLVVFSAGTAAGAGALGVGVLAGA